MNKNEILNFLNANPIFHLATIEGDKPHVRGMYLYRADESGILFHTGKMKDVHKQLTENPRVEMSFNNGTRENLMQIRVSGTVELVEDMGLKKEIVEKRPFLKPWVERDGYDSLAVYRLKNGRSVVWTMNANFAAKEPVEL